MCAFAGAWATLFEGSPEMGHPRQKHKLRVSVTLPARGMRGVALPKPTRPGACARRGGGSFSLICSPLPAGAWTSIPVPMVTATAATGPAVMAGAVLGAAGSQLPSRRGLGELPVPPPATHNHLPTGLAPGRDPPVRRSGVYFAKENQMRGRDEGTVPKHTKPIHHSPTGKQIGPCPRRGLC